MKNKSQTFITLFYDKSAFPSALTNKSRCRRCKRKSSKLNNRIGGLFVPFATTHRGISWQQVHRTIIVMVTLVRVKLIISMLLG